jgi:hypothetical protein
MYKKLKPELETKIYEFIDALKSAGCIIKDSSCGLTEPANMPLQEEILTIHINVIVPASLIETENPIQPI